MKTKNIVVGAGKQTGGLYALQLQIDSEHAPVAAEDAVDMLDEWHARSSLEVPDVPSS